MYNQLQYIEEYKMKTKLFVRYFHLYITTYDIDMTSKCSELTPVQAGVMNYHS